MRILILGAGATGGYFGALLAKAGVDVTFLVRPKRREQLKNGGLSIKSHLGDVTTPVAAITRDEISNTFDAVILSPKAYGLTDAIETIRPAVGVRSPAISRSRVDLPLPLAPTRPVRPAGRVALRPSSATVPSGQAKSRSISVMAKSVGMGLPVVVGEQVSCAVIHDGDPPDWTGDLNGRHGNGPTPTRATDLSLR